MDRPTDLPASFRTRFEGLSPLGRGAAARVFRVRDRITGRELALKLLTEATDATLRARFAREAQALSRLRHENVLAVLDHGVTPDGPYLLTELIDGPPLEGWVLERDPLETMLRVARGLEAVHAAGLVHRDLRPANVLVRPSGEPVLIDFGLVLDPERTSVTGRGRRVGSLPYLAPELLRGRAASPRSDWFAWGITLYELVEGGFPFTSDQLVEVAAGERLPRPPLRGGLARTPTGKLLVAMLEDEAALRPGSVAEIEEVLRDSSRLPTGVSEVAVRPSRRVVGGGRAALGRAPASRVGVAARALFGVFALALLVGAALGLGGWARRRAPAGASSVPRLGDREPPTSPLEPPPLGDPRPDPAPVEQALARFAEVFGPHAEAMARRPRRDQLTAHLDAELEALLDPLVSIKWRRYLRELVPWLQRAAALEGRRDRAWAAARCATLVGGLPRGFLEDLDRVRSYAYQGATVIERLPAFAEDADGSLRRRALDRYAEVLIETWGAFAGLRLDESTPTWLLAAAADMLSLVREAPGERLLGLVLVRLDEAEGDELLALARAAGRLLYDARRHERRMCRLRSGFAASWERNLPRLGEEGARVAVEGFGAYARSVFECQTARQPGEAARFQRLFDATRRALRGREAEVTEAYAWYLADYEMRSLTVNEGPVRGEVAAFRSLLEPGEGAP